MKKLILISSFILPFIGSVAQSWVQKANITAARYGAFGFSIGTKGYIGGGETTTGYLNDLWEYDPATDVWTQKANYTTSANARSRGVGFSIGNKGYTACGKSSGSTVYSALVEYDPSTNTWTGKASYPGLGRYCMASFSIGNKAYIGTGMDASANLRSDFWEYNQTTNIWTQKASYGGGVRWYATGFAISNKGYFGTGDDGNNKKNDFWEYNPSTNTWVQKANYSGVPRTWAVGFNIGLKGYLGCGGDASYNTLGNMYAYDPTSNSWSAISSIAIRDGSVGFSIGGVGYIGTGINYSPGTLNDFWEYNTCTSLAFSYNKTNVNCNGSNNGTITLNASGGSSPYQYSINGGTSFQSSNVFLNLPPSSYTLLVKDTNNCVTNSQIITITEPSTLSFTTSQTNTSCFGGNNGSITISASGGTSPFQYSNNGGSSFQSSSTFNNLSAGVYVVQVKDINTCLTSTQNVTITEPAAPPTPTITASGSTTFCQENSVTLTSSSGNSFLWSNGVTTQSVIITLSGNYSVTVSDINGCSATSTSVPVVVFPLPSVIVTPSGSTTLCQGDSVILSSNQFETYLWSNGAVTQSIITTIADTYIVSVTDTNGCSASSPAIAVIVNQIPSMPSIIGDTAFCFEQNSVLSVDNPCINCTFIWSSGQSGENISIDTAGIYYVVASNSCGSSPISNILNVLIYPLPPVPTITATDSLLSSSALTGNQWYFNGSIISGAVFQTYIALQSGEYTVIDTDTNGCFQSSLPFTYITVGLLESFEDNSILIFPNPSTGVFNFDIQTILPTGISIYNIFGECIFNADRIIPVIDLSGYPKGNYCLRIQTSDKNIYKVLVVQ